MRNVFLSFLLFVSGCAPALAGDMVYNTQIRMMPPPTEDKHVATKEYVDGADVALGQRVDGVEATANNSVQYDADGNITFQAGMDMNTSIPQPDDPEGNPVPPVVRTVLDTDAAGNFIVGNPDSELNLRASMRPTVEIAGGDAAESVALMSDLSAYETSADHDADMAYKADLVGGRVPESQMAPGAISKNYTVPTQADLVTLTQAVINDRALTGAGTTDDPHQRFLLWSEPPTDINNWVDITGGGGGGSGDSGVVSWAGKSGAVIPEIEDVTGLRAELDDKANASDLAGYATIASPALTGTPTATTPPTTATGTRIATADFVNTRIASGNAATATTLQTARTIQTNLESASAASFNGSANITPGVAGILPIANGGSGRSTSPVFATDAPLAGGGDSTADRTLHILPATAATETEPGAPGSVVYAADNDSTSRDKAMTPAGLTAAIANIPPPTPVTGIGFPSDRVVNIGSTYTAPANGFVCGRSTSKSTLGSHIASVTVTIKNPSGVILYTISSYIPNGTASAFGPIRKGCTALITGPDSVGTFIYAE